MLFLAGCSAGPSSQTPTKLVVDPASMDFGKVLPTQNYEHAFAFTNLNKKKLCITKLKSTCPCVKPTLPVNMQLPLELKPGETVNIAVKLDPTAQSKNLVHGRVYLETDNLKDPSHELPVTAEIIPEYTVTPEKVDWGSVKRGQPTSLSLQFTQAGETPVEITSIDTPQNIQAVYKKSPTMEKVYEVTLSLDPDTPQSLINGKITLRTNCKRVPAYTIPVHVEIKGIECSITPKIVVFDTSIQKDKVPSVTISGSTELTVTDVKCSVTSIQPKFQRCDSPGSWQVDLPTEKNTTPGNIQGKIYLTLKEGTLTEIREIGLFGTTQ